MFGLAEIRRVQASSPWRRPVWVWTYRDIGAWPLRPTYATPVHSQPRSSLISLNGWLSTARCVRQALGGVSAFQVLTGAAADVRACARSWHYDAKDAIQILRWNAMVVEEGILLVA